MEAEEAEGEEEEEWVEEWGVTGQREREETKRLLTTTHNHLTTCMF